MSIRINEMIPELLYAYSYMLGELHPDWVEDWMEELMEEKEEGDEDDE